ncbi:MAG: pyruvate formate-lyase-activating protein [Oscillospiraceae bacterium]|nr:pyruvate formate-lyase-activating protein [Oscillospiraceae bacterium]
MKDIAGKIHSIETCGTVDGPGIRYVIFTQGCPLRCLYCHNPDTWKLNSKSAIEKPVSQLMEDIVKYKSYFKFSGGGVTLTGGEPLLQEEFAAALFEQCKKEGLHTCLDTSGHGEINNATERLLANTDLILLDIKSATPDTFKKVTGLPIDTTLEFARYLLEQNIEAWARFVLVPGLTDDEDELHTLASYLTTLKNVTRVGVLPFHQLGAYKWQDMKMRYQLADTPEPTPAQTARVKELFRGYGLSVK